MCFIFILKENNNKVFSFNYIYFRNFEISTPPPVPPLTSSNKRGSSYLQNVIKINIFLLLTKFVKIKLSLYIYTHTLALEMYVFLIEMIWRLCCFCIYSVQKTGEQFVGNLLEIVSPLMPFETFVALILCNKPICYFYQ